jgi:acyl-ACP thioesterase
MPDIVKICTSNFNVRSYEINANKKAPLPTISGYLQESALKHVSLLEFSVPDLLKINLFWVLSRLMISIERYPDWEEDIKVETWSPGFDLLYAHREFRILDKKSNIIGWASSSGILVNIETRRPEPTSLVFHCEDIFYKEKVFDNELRKIKKIENLEFSHKINIRYSDLNFNHHVNNIKYLEWLIDSVPLEIRRNHVIFNIER